MRSEDFPTAIGASGRRSVNKDHLDPVADAWAATVWEGVSETQGCAYAYGVEGSHDSAGRWRRKHIRHIVAGGQANQARAISMALHLCEVIRQRAFEDLRLRKADSRSRKAFERACAQRLVERLQERCREIGGKGGDEQGNDVAANRMLLPVGTSDIPLPLRRATQADDERSVRRRGKMAADDISLVLRVGLRPGLPRRKKNRRQGSRRQTSFEF